MSKVCSDTAANRPARILALRCVLLAVLCALLLTISLVCSADSSSDSSLLQVSSLAWRQNSEWTVLQFDNPTVSIQSSQNNPIENSNGRIEILLLGGSTPLSDLNIDVYPAVKNITGQWSTHDREANIRTDNSGFAAVEVKPGDYALRLDEYFGRIYGIYGVNVLSNDYGGAPLGASTIDTSMIPVHVRSGEIVAIMIRLAKLVVGVTSKNGKIALPEKLVYVYPETTDIAGKPIPVKNYGSRAFRTSVEGTAIWYLGAGTYSIRVDNFPSQDTYLYHVQVEPGEENQVILTEN